ncbi:MAG: site-specific integrase, partial [bacterium]
MPQTAQDWVHKYLEYLKLERNLAFNTIVSYERDLKSFITFLENSGINCASFDPQAVDKKTIRRYLAGLSKTCRPASVERAAAAIRGFFRF